MRALHSLHVALAATLIAACAGDAGPDENESSAETADAARETVAVDTPPAAADTVADAGESTLLLQDIPNGAPMPDAERTRGAPPYPDAIVWNRTDKNREDARAFEAFTTDPVEQVVAFYERHLSSWRRVDAPDTDLWVREPDMASVAVSEWDRENAHPDLPPFLREDARTIIGVAWRIDETTPTD